jgi:hypothetical protein
MQETYLFLTQLKKITRKFAKLATELEGSETTGEV